MSSSSEFEMSSSEELSSDEFSLDNASSSFEDSPPRSRRASKKTNKKPTTTRTKNSAASPARASTSSEDEEEIAELWRKPTPKQSAPKKKTPTTKFGYLKSRKAQNFSWDEDEWHEKPKKFKSEDDVTAKKRSLEEGGSKFQKFKSFFQRTQNKLSHPESPPWQGDEAGQEFLELMSDHEQNYELSPNDPASNLTAINQISPDIDPAFEQIRIPVLGTRRLSRPPSTPIKKQLQKHNITNDTSITVISESDNEELSDNSPVSRTKKLIPIDSLLNSPAKKTGSTFAHPQDNFTHPQASFPHKHDNFSIPQHKASALKGKSLKLDDSEDEIQFIGETQASQLPRRTRLRKSSEVGVHEASPHAQIDLEAWAPQGGLDVDPEEALWRKERLDRLQREKDSHRNNNTAKTNRCIRQMKRENQRESILNEEALKIEDLSTFTSEAEDEEEEELDEAQIVFDRRILRPYLFFLLVKCVEQIVELCKEHSKRIAEFLGHFPTGGQNEEIINVRDEIDNQMQNCNNNTNNQNNNNQNNNNQNNNNQNNNNQNNNNQNNNNQNNNQKNNHLIKMNDNHTLGLVEPVLLTKTLKSWQLIGLNWLYLLNQEGLNGILADEMGLGKTVQTIALLALLFSKKQLKNALIVVPASTLSNWKKEIEVWCPRLKPLLYYGSQSERADLQYFLRGAGGLKSHPVILTTYSILYQKYDQKFFRRVDWTYLILDEAHTIKNQNSNRFKTLKKIRTDHIVLLTGSPLQNNLNELWSLLHFLMPDLFDKETRLWFETLKSDQEDALTKRVRAILSPFILRRLKADVDLALPSKTEKIIWVDMTEDQQRMYDLFRDASKESDTKVKGLAILTEFRKICNHPAMRLNLYKKKLREIAQVLHRKETETPLSHIMEDLAINSDFEIHSVCKSDEDLSHHCLDEEKEIFSTSGKLVVLDSLLPRLIKDKHRILIFSQMKKVLDILEMFLSARHISFTRLDGQTKVTERQGLIDEFYTDQSISVFLLTTTAGGVGINLTASDVVIFYDLSWNPSVDLQAQDRVHRLGQEKEVTIYNLIVRDSIEEYIHKVSSQKKNYNELLLEEENQKSKSSTTNEISTNYIQNVLKMVFSTKKV